MCRTCTLEWQEQLLRLCRARRGSGEGLLPATVHLLRELPSLYVTRHVR